MQQFSFHCSFLSLHLHYTQLHKPTQETVHCIQYCRRNQRKITCKKLYRTNILMTETAKLSKKCMTLTSTLTTSNGYCWAFCWLCEKRRKKKKKWIRVWVSGKFYCNVLHKIFNLWIAWFFIRKFQRLWCVNFYCVLQKQF